MRVASLAEVKAKLSAVLQEIETTGPVVITRNGKAVAVLLAPVDDDDLERLLLSRSPQLRSILSESRDGIRAGKGLPHASFWKALATRSPETPAVREKPSPTRARLPRAKRA
jgi:prevent-host-death family protein